MTIEDIKIKCRWSSYHFCRVDNEICKIETCPILFWIKMCGIVPEPSIMRTFVALKKETESQK